MTNRSKMNSRLLQAKKRKIQKRDDKKVKKIGFKTKPGNPQGQGNQQNNNNQPRIIRIKPGPLPVMFRPVRCDMSSYNSHVFSGGIPIFSRQLNPYQLSRTDQVLKDESVGYFSNPAMQRMVDDICRTFIVGLDSPHELLGKRLGKEVTSETINNYLEILNSAMSGAVEVQEQMIEKYPGLLEDSNVRIFTGDDILADEIDKRYLIDINKLFPIEQAKQIKAAMGKSSWQAVHIPSIVSRTCDINIAYRWSAIQLHKTFVDAYNMCASDAVVADLAYTARHARVLQMADLLSTHSLHGLGDPSQLSFGLIADVIQTSRVVPADPVVISLNAMAAGTMLYDQVWQRYYKSDNIGIDPHSTSVYLNDILDDFCYYGLDRVVDKYGGLAKAPQTIEVAKELASEVTLYGIEQLASLSTPLEDHFGGSSRASVLAAASGITAAIASGHSQGGLAAFYLSMLLHREGRGRLGFFGYDFQDQCGPTNFFSYQSDEGNPLNLRAANYPNYAMNVGHQGEYAGISSAAHAGRMDAFACNPLIKVTFANPALVFDWANVRDAFDRGDTFNVRAANLRSRSLI